jgi:hypothetical protein
MLQTLRSHYDTARIRWQGFMESAIGGFPVKVHPMDRPFWIDTNFNAWEPETPRHLDTGIWSRRIMQEHRLVYRGKEHRIPFSQARYHCGG